MDSGQKIRIANRETKAFALGMKLFNSAEFAKELLWRLARQQADAMDNRLMLIEILSRQTGKPAKQILEEREPKCKKKAEELYLKSLQAAGLANPTDSIQGDDASR